MSYMLRKGIKRISLNTSNIYEKDTVYTDKDLEGELTEGIEKYFEKVDGRKVSKKSKEGAEGWI